MTKRLTGLQSEEWVMIGVSADKREKRMSLDGIMVEGLLDQIKEFAIATFDHLDQNKNGFLSQEELEYTIEYKNPGPRELSYLKFLLRNLNTISAAHDDGDGIKPCGISRKDILGISRVDLLHYFDS